MRAVHKHRPDVIYERYNLNLVSGAWTRRVLRVPLLLQVNAPLGRERSGYGGLVRPHLARRLEAWVWRCSSVQAA